MEKEIEKAIKETLVVVNKQSIKYAVNRILRLFNDMPHSYGIVRWHDNEHEDVVCVDRTTAEEYVRKYNKLAGVEKCYVDEDIWLPLNEA